EGCTALECLLLDQAVAEAFLHHLAKHASEADLTALTLRLDDKLAAALPDPLASAVTVEPLVAADLGREYLRATLAAVEVSDLVAAVSHINRYGSRHTEGIVTEDRAVADEFCRRVDAAAVVVNGSVRLHDGPTLGLGSELVISTGRLHVRGPVTLADLMSRGWRVDGNGALRFRTN
ncbi:MAG TPA: glutamate-5-semialdehyde dehydrogenase, partial [Micromonosporaceae bacterium]